MATVDTVIVEFEARLAKYNADLRSSTALFQQSMMQQGKSIAKLEADIQRSSGQISSSLKGIAGTLAGYFTGRELVGLLDGFTRFQNQLKVAGLEGANLAGVQKELLDLSTKYGVSLEALGGLYGKSSQAALELGASQSQIMQLTEATSQSLLITGTSSEAASGAILGLTQALASGTVRAEEFNQINEGGLRPLLEAAAASERFGGSVAKLRTAVVDGKVSSQEFFNLVLEGSSKLESQAAKATLTLSGAFTALSNQLMVYFGEAGQGSGVTEALANAIKMLADNLNAIIPALAVIATIMAGRVAAGAIASAAASIRLAIANAQATASANALAAANTRLAATSGMVTTRLNAQAAAQSVAGATTARAAMSMNTVTSGSIAAATAVGRGSTALTALGMAGRGLAGILGGPVGIALTAVTLGLGYLATASDSSRDSIIDAARATGEGADAFERHFEEARKAREAQQALDAAARSGAGGLDVMRGASDALTESLKRMGIMAQWAANQAAIAAVKEARSNVIKAKSQYLSDKAAYESAPQGSSKGSLEIRSGLGARLSSSERLLGDATDNLNDASAAANVTAKELNTAVTGPKGRGGGGAPGKPKKTPKGRSGPKGKSAEDQAREAEDKQWRHDDEMARYRQEELRGQIELAGSLGERADLETKMLSEEYQQRTVELDRKKKRGELTAQQYDEELKALGRQYGIIANEVTLAEGRAMDLAEIQIALKNQKISAAEAADKMDKVNQYYDGLAAEGRETVILVGDSKKSLQAQLAERRQAIETERHLADLADAEYRLKEQGLRDQYDMAGTDRERRKIALELVDAEYDYLESVQARVLASETATDEEKELAKIRLDAIKSGKEAAINRALRDTESNRERFMRELNLSSEQMNEKFDDIAIDGLQNLNDQLVDAIMNSKNLADVFKNVAKSIIADLLRIAIQQAVIKPLAEALFPNGGGSSGGGGIGGILSKAAQFVGAAFGGGAPGRAIGGPVNAGQFYRVNEGASPGRVEGFVPTGSGMVIPLGQMDALKAGSGGGGHVTVRLELSGDVDARIIQTSSQVAVQVVKASQPATVEAAVNETFRRGSRGRM